MRAKTGDREAKEWMDEARALGTALGFRPFWEGEEAGK
jgi:hypothetical protein